jgi:hypothetical protein
VYGKSTGHSGSTALYFSEPFYSTRTPFAMGRRPSSEDRTRQVQVLTTMSLHFTGIQSPDRAWAVLVGHNDALDDHQRDNIRHPTPYAARIQAKKFSALVGD